MRTRPYDSTKPLPGATAAGSASWCRVIRPRSVDVRAVGGGATGMVGDPSGKSQERNLLDEETIRHNQDGLKKQLVKATFILPLFQFMM